MSDSSLIVARLREVRRRQFLALLAGSTCIGFCSLAVLGLLLGFFLFHLPFRPGVAAILLCGAALAVGVALSFLRMPSWKETARLVDRALELQQRIETAWEYLAPRDEIDRLLLADASRRLFPMNPAEVVPIRLDRAAGIALMSAILVVTGAGIIRLLSSWNDSGSRFGNRPQLVTGTPAQSDAARSASRKQLQNALRPSTSALPSANPESVRRPQGNESAPADKNPDAASLQPSQQPPLTSKPDKGAGGDQMKAAASSSSSSPNNAGTASIRAAEKKGSEGSGSLAARAAESQAGGVLSGKGVAQSPDRPAPSGIDAALLAGYIRDYQAYRLAAEQALTKEKIPPGFRKYIADYFKALHP